MDVSCDIYEKRRCTICRSVDIVIYVCTYPKCRFDLSSHPRSNVKVKSEGADTVSY